MIIVIAMPSAAWTALRAKTRPSAPSTDEGSEDPEQHGLAGAGHEVTSASSVRAWASTYSRWVSVAAETFPR